MTICEKAVLEGIDDKAERAGVEIDIIEFRQWYALIECCPGFASTMMEIDGVLDVWQAGPGDDWWRT